MRILGVDIGKKGGIACLDNGLYTVTDYSFISLKDTYQTIKACIGFNQIDSVITGKPNRMYNIILNHAQFIGVIGMACEEANIPLIIESDSTIRAYILGRGNGRRKDLVHEKYQGPTADVSDAMMFADYLYRKQSEI